MFFRCLLHRKAAQVMSIIENIFALVLKFHNQLTTANWESPTDDDIENDVTGNPAADGVTSLRNSSFEQIQRTHLSFKDHAAFLFKGSS